MNPQAQIWYLKNKLTILVSVAAFLVLGGSAYTLKAMESTPSDTEASNGVVTIDAAGNVQTDEQVVIGGSDTPDEGGAHMDSHGAGAPVSPAPPTPPPPPLTGRVYDVSFAEFCFDPERVTISQGDTVKFKNFAEFDQMWVASDPHPDNNAYPEFNAGQGYRANSYYSFTFNRKGTWGYHNHLQPDCRGAVVVE
jgi:plastocyanin